MNTIPYHIYSLVIHIHVGVQDYSVSFSVFLQILDEVEKRRAISPALVQPFMRGIMEAPFPAPGRTITVKNFLPGSGTEVRGYMKEYNFGLQQYFVMAFS